MATLFTRILEGELPGRFVWKDEVCAVFLTIAPLRPGHALVVPREEIDHWVDLPDDLATHLMGVAKAVGAAQQAAFRPARVGLIIAGMEVPHTHLHVVPIEREADLHFENADADAKAEDLDAAAAKLREALLAAGHEEAKGTG